MEIQPVITLKPLGSSCGSLGCLEARTGLSWKLLGPTCLFNKKRILKTLSSLLGQIPLGHPLTHSLCCPSVKQQKAHPRTRGTPTRKSAGDTGPLPQTPSPRLFKYNPTIANHVADSWKSNLSSIFKPWGVLVAILGVLKRELGCHGSS